MVLTPPFALFILHKNVTKEVSKHHPMSMTPNAWNSREQFLEDSLKRAHEGDPTPGWSFWVATKSYDDMPAPPQHDKPDEEGTEPPLPDNWSSPWIGKTIEECAKWLQEMPTYDGEQYYLDTSVRREYFVAMDEFSMEDDTMLVCRVTKKEDGGVKVDYFPQAVDEVQMQMWTNEGSMFDNKAEAYQATMRKEGKPDRSRF